jgi:hypothetical protein
MAAIPGAVAETARLSGFQTLISVNNCLDNETFKSGDRTIITKWWDKVFQQNSVCEDIFNAIASRSGAGKSSDQSDLVRIKLSLYIYI